MQKVIHRSLEEELLTQWADQVKFSPVPVILAMGLIAFMASQYVSAWYWGTWMVVVIAAQVARRYVFRQFPVNTHIPVEQRINAAVVFNWGQTLVHSASLVWFPLFSPYYGAIQSVLFIGIGVTSVMLSAGFPGFARTHIFFCLVPLFSLWVYSGLFGEGGSAALVLAVSGFGYCVTVFKVAGRIFLLYKQAFDTRGQLEVALAKAEAAGAAKTRFLAAASHDLRQPIHTLTLFSAALGLRNLDERTNLLVKNIKISVEALAYQLDGLLDISKLDAGIVTVRRSSFCLVNLLQRMQEEFATLAANRNIKLTLDCPALVVVGTDSALLERIIRNVLSNAIHHNRHCTVDIRIVSMAENWQLIIADSGIGVAAEEQENIFEEFYQLDNPERDRSNGLGLGLAIVRRLTDLLHIDMEFESQPGRGTQFTFTIPADAQVQPAAPTVEYAANSLESLMILVVDDEPAVREGMRVLLESLGCRVATADSSDTAIAAATTEKPNIALVDLRLRDHDSGLVTIDRLRHIYPGLPAIIISGDTAPDRLLATSNAAIPVLIKPVLVNTLKEAIIRHCFIAD